MDALAIKSLSEKEQGIIICIPNQDGRGKGTEFKLATLYLQEELGLDTTESFSLLEKDDSIISIDDRDYNGAIAIIKFLEVPNNIIMGTNNPEKLDALINAGFNVKKEAVLAKITEFTKNHLAAKKNVLGHSLN